MKDKQEIRQIGYVLETLDPILLDKLAANISSMTQADFDAIHAIRQRLALDLEADDGL